MPTDNTIVGRSRSLSPIPRRDEEYRSRSPSPTPKRKKFVDHPFIRPQPLHRSVVRPHGLVMRKLECSFCDSPHDITTYPAIGDVHLGWLCCADEGCQARRANSEAVFVLPAAPILEHIGGENFVVPRSSGTPDCGQWNIAGALWNCGHLEDQESLDIKLTHKTQPLIKWMTMVEFLEAQGERDE